MRTSAYALRVTQVEAASRKSSESLEKRSCRNLVFDLITGTVPGKINYLGLPGLSWELEKRLLDERPGSIITGVEIETSLYNKSLSIAPKNSTLILGDVFDIISGNKPYNWNAVWLDLYGCSSQKALDALPKLASKLDQRVPVPVAITYFEGRNKKQTKLLKGFNSSDPQAALIRWLLGSQGTHRLSNPKVVVYNNMGMILGVMTRHKSNPRILVNVENSYVMIDEEDVGVLHGVLLGAEVLGDGIETVTNWTAKIIQENRGLVSRPSYRKDGNMYNLCQTNI